MNFLKKSFLASLFIGFSLVGFSQRTIYVKENKIYSACDEPIVMRGVNEMFIWSADKTGITTLPEIAKTGSNTVRLVWTTDGSVAELETLIQNCLNQNMIPVPELHDATGDFSQLQKLLDYWKKPEVLALIQKYKKWIIVNIGNEIGSGSETNEQWEAYYKDAITQLRDAGIDVPLMIDCGEYGSNEKYFLSKGNSLLTHDPLHNLIFSVHTYWIQPDSDQGRKKRLDDLITEAKAKKLPFIIGEGPQKAASPWSTYCNVDFPYAYLIQRCQEEGIGWLSWSWGAVDNNDCGAPNSVFDITTDGKFGSWATTFAEEIMVTDANSIKNTSIIPASLINGNCGEVCTPVQLVSNSINICLSGEATISIVDDRFLTENHSIKWFFNNVEIANTSGKSYTASEVGNYRIEIDSASSCMVFDEVAVNGKIVVDLGVDQTICTSDNVTLNLQKDEPDYMNTWYFNGVEIVSAQLANTLIANQAGTYVAKVYSDFCEGKDTVIVNSKLPIVKDTSICSGIEQTLRINGNGNYVWYGNATLTEKLFTGSEYSVNQDDNKTYYIRDESGFEGKVGKPALDNSFWDTWDNESKENKLGFEVFETLTVKTFDVYAAAAGTMNVVFYNNELSAIETLSFTVSAGKNTLNVNKVFDAGIYYADVAESSIHLAFNHDEGEYNTEYPYILKNAGKTILSIDRTIPTWAKDKPWYLFFYNWTIAQSNGAECKAKEMIVSVNDDGCLTSVDKQKTNQELTVYPNPTNDVLNLSHSVHYKLYTTNGLLIEEGQGNTVNMQKISKGFYILQTEEKYIKVVKQ
jgi:hypothetical protein